MAIEEVITLRTESKGTGSVKSIREELKQAKNEAVQLSREFGALDPRAVSAAKKVAALNDEMQDLNQRVAGLNPDKFEAIATVTQGVAGGISAAVGAMALFGEESEETQKILAKVQGAIAFSQGIQQVLNLRNSFGSLASLIKTQLVAAFTTLKGAIIATGIGALAVALGVLYSTMTDTTDASDELNESLESQRQKVEDLELEYARITGTISDFEAELKIIQLNADRAISKLQEQAAKTAEENIGVLEKIKGALLSATGQYADAAISQTKKFSDNYKKELTKIQPEIDLINQEAQIRREMAEKKHQQEITKAQQEAYKKQQEQRLEAQKQHERDLEQSYKTAARFAKAARDAQAAINEETAKLNTDKFGQDLIDLQKWYDAQKIIIEAGGGDITALNELFNAKQALIQNEALAEASENQKRADEDAKKQKEATEKANTEATKRGIEARQAMQQSAFDATSQFLGATSQLFGTATAAGKAFALGQIAADTARALTGALANSQAPTADNLATGGIAGIAKYIALAATIISNVNRARQILGAGQQGANVNAQAPNIQASTQSGLPSSDEMAGQFDKTRVYVTEGDISGTQNRVRRNRNVSVI